MYRIAHGKGAKQLARPSRDFNGQDDADGGDQREQQPQVKLEPSAPRVRFIGLIGLTHGCRSSRKCISVTRSGADAGTVQVAFGLRTRVTRVLTGVLATGVERAE